MGDGIAAVLDYARSANVKLAIQPLHPMYAADKSCINRMAQAREVCQTLRHPMLGIAVDVYMSWWDPDCVRRSCWPAFRKPLRVPRLRLACHRRCHMLNDRGLMGDGGVDLRIIRGWVEEAGF